MAFPTTAPSTFTCTLMMAVPTAAMLSRVQPATVTMPETVAFGLGVSMTTVGGPIDTVTVTWAKPTSAGLSISVAATVMVCMPGLYAPVFNRKLKPTLGHPGGFGVVLQALTSVRGIP